LVLFKNKNGNLLILRNCLFDFILCLLCPRTTQKVLMRTVGDTDESKQKRRFAQFGRQCPERELERQQVPGELVQHGQSERELASPRGSFSSKEPLRLL